MNCKSRMRKRSNDSMRVGVRGMQNEIEGEREIEGGAAQDGERGETL